MSATITPERGRVLPFDLMFLAPVAAIVSVITPFDRMTWRLEAALVLGCWHVRELRALQSNGVGQ